MEVGTGCAASARAQVVQKPPPRAVPSNTGTKFYSGRQHPGAATPNTGSNPSEGLKGGRNVDAQADVVGKASNAGSGVKTTGATGTGVQTLESRKLELLVKSVTADSWNGQSHDTTIGQSQFDMPSSWGSMDASGLTHAELVHHFWYYFRHQVGALKDALSEVRQDVTSMQRDLITPKSGKSDGTPGLVADVTHHITKVDEAMQASDKGWREEVSRLSGEIQALRAESSKELQLRASSLDVELKTKLASLDIERVNHDEHVQSMQDRMTKCEEGVCALRLDLTEASAERCANSTELRELLSKSLSDLSIGLQTDILHSSNKCYLHVEEQIAYLQAALESEDQSMRADMEQNFDEHHSAIRDYHQTLASSIRALDSKLRDMIAEESGKNREEISELGSCFQGGLQTLRKSSDESFAHVQNLIATDSERHQRNYGPLRDKFSDLEKMVKDGSQAAAIVRQHVDELRSIPLIRGALSRGT